MLSSLFSTSFYVIIGSPTGALIGLQFVVMALIANRPIVRGQAEAPVFEDWLFHVLLPLIAYATLAASAYVTRSLAREPLFCAGAAALLLFFIGIHNSSDAVTYHLFVGNGNQRNGRILAGTESTRAVPRDALFGQQR